MCEQVRVRGPSDVREVSERAVVGRRGRRGRQRRGRRGRAAGPADDAEGVLRVQPGLRGPPAAAAHARAAAHGQGPRRAQPRPRLG